MGVVDQNRRTRRRVGDTARMHRRRGGRDRTEHRGSTGAVHPDDNMHTGARRRVTNESIGALDADESGWGAGHHRLSAERKNLAWKVEDPIQSFINGIGGVGKRIRKGGSLYVR
ncbi:hypothetical protein RN2511_018940 [Rhodococcus sp. NKCM2511]|nr:hypothetical protein RN2511_018940 [Rhodococcus sp. NKCM2511]